MPVIVRLEDGTIVEGRVDFAWTESASWTVIDYKTNPPTEFAISPSSNSMYWLAASHGEACAAFRWKLDNTKMSTLVLRTRFRLAIIFQTGMRSLGRTSSHIADPPLT
jgi:hypothetical protein